MGAAHSEAMASESQTTDASRLARGLDPDQALNPKAQDSRAIKHNGPNPHYGPKRKAS